MIFLILFPLNALAAYTCPATCLPPACVCGSTAIPGGLSLANTPQFVTITWDDAVQVRMFDNYKTIATTTLNKNGCPIPQTYFVSMNFTDFHAVQFIQNQYGAEIAAHTINHPYLDTLSPAIAEAEIVGSRSILSVYGGVAKTQLTGFRHPFLAYNKNTFDSVFAAGSLYDSSITIDPQTQPFWPHTLDYGAPYDPLDCVVAANCPPGASLIYPGKWEIPMYVLKTTTDAVWVSMDPDTPSVTTTAQALANLKHSFTIHYNKKLPFGLYQHMAQFIAYPADQQTAKVKMMTDFIAWMSTTYPDVWFVTNQQLIKWIQAPVPLSKMQSAFPCVPAAFDSSNPEICDGIDNTGTGTGDTPLLSSCTFPAVGSNFLSCFGCPSIQPNFTLPLPPRSGTTVVIPDAGCPLNESWDPIKGVCTPMKRPQVSIPNNVNNASSNPTSASGNIGASYLSALTTAVGLVFVAVGYAMQ